jgi:hypothetical protein
MKKALLLISIVLCLFTGQIHAQAPVTIIATDSITRPWNHTAYTANDVVNDSNYTRMLKFSTVSVNSSGTTPVMNKGFGGVIISALLSVGDTANTANGSFKLLLFRDTVVNVADNAAWATAAYYNTRQIAEIDFALTNNGTASNYSYVTGLNLPFQTESDDRNIYGVLLAKAGFKPTVAQKIIIKLGLIRN